MKPIRVVRTALLVLAACGRPKEEAATRNTDAEARADARTEATASEREPDATPGRQDAEQAEHNDAYLTGTPRFARAIGHTSVAFKVELSNGKKAAFKPASKRGPFRYKGEIAAYRLGVALGLPNVPRALFRALPAVRNAAVEAESGAFFGSEAIVTGGVVKGALMPWIDGLGFLPLEQEPLRSQWKAWLKTGNPIPDDQRALAAQISTLVAFDFVTGNWDRWSGGNVGFDKARGMLLFIDNDGAFFDTPPADALRRNEKLLLGVDRFSRALIRRFRELDRDSLIRALGEETPGVPLLGSKALDGLLERRARLLEIVDAKRSDADEDGVLFFP